MTLYAEYFEKKFINFKYSRSSLDPENYRCGHQQPHHFISSFADFPTLVDNSGKPNTCGQFKAKELAVTWEKVCRLSQKERLLEPSIKILISFITGELLSATMSIALF